LGRQPRRKLPAMSPPLTADEILAKCAEAYASCRTYQDVGEVRTAMIRGPRRWERHTHRRPFRTYFDRPSRFFFEYREMTVGPEDEWAGGFVCSNGDRFTYWSTLRMEGVPAPTDLEHALGAFTGVSGGSASFAATLLDIGKAHNPLPGSGTAQLLAEAVVDGRSCFRIVGARLSGPQSEVWIDRATFAVRRAFHRIEINEETRRRNHEQVTLAFEKLAKDDPRRAMMAKFIDRPAPEHVQDVTTESVTEFSPLLDAPIDPAVFDVSARPELIS